MVQDEFNFFIYLISFYYITLIIKKYGSLPKSVGRKNEI
jgi:hypothetical protein